MRKLWRNRPLIIAWIAVILFVVLAGFTIGERDASAAFNLFASAAMPVQEWVMGVTDDISGFFTRVFTPSAIQEENEELKRQATEYARILALYEETERENARLSELLNFTDTNKSLQFLTGKVIARTSDPYIDVLTLNIGSRQGVKEKMAVICPSGIVGRVVEVGTTWCKVRTLQNEDMRISVMVTRTRDEGMLGGLITNGNVLIGLQLYYLPANADIEIGDEIVTSGLGGVFPKGLYVGKVQTLGKDSDAFDACISIEVDYEHLEEVIVVLGVDEAVDG